VKGGDLMNRYRKLVTFDWAIKKLLRSKANFGILEGFLSVLLKEEIKVLAILESESNQKDRNDKFNRVDLKAENHKGEIIIIEIQNDYEYDYLLRMAYGVSKAMTEHMNMGDEYSDIKKIISINIVYFDLGHGDDYVYHGFTNFIGIHKKDELQLTDAQKKEFGRERIRDLYPEYYILKVNRFDDYAKDPLDEWIYFLKNTEIKSSFRAPGLKEAAKKLSVMKLSESEQRAYDRYLEDLSYAASMAKSVKLEAEEAVERSFLKGLAEGRTKGMEKGMEKRDREIVLKMKQSGLTSDQIHDFTGITMERIINIFKS